MYILSYQVSSNVHHPLSIISIKLIELYFNNFIYFYLNIEQ